MDLDNYFSEIGGAMTCNPIKFNRSCAVLPCISDSNDFFRLINVLDPSDYCSIPLNSYKYMPLYSYADLNKDGYDDIVIVEKILTSQSYKCHIVWGKKNNHLSELCSISTINFECDGQVERIILNDMNSDGLIDIAVISNKGTTILRNYGCKSLSEKCTFSKQCFLKSIYYDSTKGRMFTYGDFNHDGICDIVKSENHDYVWYFGNGSFNFTEKRDEYAFWDDHGTKFSFPIDYNMDGKTDFAEACNDFILINNNTTIGHSNPSINEWNLLNGDFNGDGRPELLTIGYSLTGNGKDSKNIYITSFGKDNVGGLVNEITTPFHTYNFEYAPLTDKSVYTSNEYYHNSITLKSPLYVVKNFIDDDTETSYQYKNLLYEPTGKGIVGFNSFSSNRLGLTTLSTYELDESAILYPKSVVTYSKTDTAKLQNFTYDILFTAENKAYFLQLSETKETDYLRGISTKTNYSSYQYGTPTQKIVEVDSVTKIQTTLSGKTKVANYNINLYANKTVKYVNSEGSTSEKTYYEYNGIVPCKTIKLKGSDLAVTTKNTYDKFGNKLTETIYAKNCETKTTNFKYTNSGRFLSFHKLPEGTAMNFNWNEDLGKLLKKSVTLGGSSYDTTYVDYDGFNHCLSEKYPDGRIHSFSSSFSNLLGKEKYVENTSLTGTPTVSRMFNANGQLVREEKNYVDGKKRSVYYEYDEDGRLVTISFPYMGLTPSYPFKETRTYDVFGRVKSIFEYGKGTTTYTYNGSTTNITSPTKKKKLVLNSAGLLGESVENGESVVYTYYSNGLLKSSRANGLTTTMKYDEAGNRISINSPEIGEITSTFDAYGREIYRKTEDGSEINYIYDTKGRLTERSDNDHTVSFLYDSKNQIIKETSDNYSCVYSYDKWNRLTKKTDTIFGSKFVTKYTYQNDYGEASSVSYPSGKVLKRTYDDYGYLTNVSFNGTNIWKPSKLDNRGNITEENICGVSRLYKYNNANNLVNESANYESSKLMDLSYAYSGVNITCKTDAVFSNSESYEYDDQNRLSNVLIKNSNNGTSLSGPIHYDDLNNQITAYDKHWKSIMYDNNQMSHVEFKGTAPVSYDKRYINFNPYRMASNIQYYTQNENFTYRSDHTLCMSSTDLMGVNKKKKYYIDDYEKEVTKDGLSREIHYLCGGNGLAAIYVNSNGKDTLFAAITDRQNSLTAIMDVATKKIEYFSYKPWGMRRKASDWTINVTNDVPARFSRGFCMHEHLTKYGLINMGGRLYDSHVNQFVSPDPHIQHPDSWVNHNRFAYCLHNPILYTDPTGNDYFGFYDGFMNYINQIILPQININIQLPQYNYQSNVSSTNFTNGIGACTPTTFNIPYYPTTYCDIQNQHVLSMPNFNTNISIPDVKVQLQQTSPYSGISSAVNDVISSALQPTNTALTSINTSITSMEGIIATTGQSLSNMGKAGKIMSTVGKSFGFAGAAVATYSGYLTAQSGNPRGYLDMAATITGAFVPVCVSMGLVSNPVGWCIIAGTTIYGISTTVYDLYNK